MSRSLLLVIPLVAGCHWFFEHRSGTGDGPGLDRPQLDDTRVDRAPVDGARADWSQIDRARGDGLRSDGPRSDGPRSDGPGKLDQEPVAPGTVLWVKGIGGPMTDYGRAVAVDLAGHVYIAGSVMGPVDFNPGGVAKTLPNSGGLDGFVASYTAAGVFRWVRSPKASSKDDHVYGLAVDASHTWVTGSTDTVSPFLHRMPSSGLSGDLHQDWLSTGAGAGWALALDASAVYVAGFFTDKLLLFGATLTRTGPTAFVVGAKKLDGGHLWSWQHTADSQARTIAVSGGTVYVAGYTGAAPDVLLLQYAASSGVPTGGPTILGGSGSDQALGVAASLGASYLVGSYSAGANLAGSPLTSVGKSDLFVRRVWPGNQWAIGQGSTGDDTANGVAVAASGQIYVTGQLGAPTAALSAGIFVGGWSSTGAAVSPWPMSFGGTTDSAFGVALDPSGSALYLVGSYSSSSLSFGKHTVKCNACTSDIFLVKIQL